MHVGPSSKIPIKHLLSIMLAYSLILKKGLASSSEVSADYTALYCSKLTLPDSQWATKLHTYLR
jgi:hypothetical protein